MININADLALATNNYMKKTNRSVHAPFFPAHETPVWACLNNVFLENKHIKHFYNLYRDPCMNYTEDTLLEGYCDEQQSSQLLAYLLQGTIETICHPIGASPEAIHQKNLNFFYEFSKIIYETEKIILDVLKRGKFLVPKHRVLSFNKLIQKMHEKQPKLNCNSIALYSKITHIINKYGTAQLKLELKERMEELRVRIREL